MHLEHRPATLERAVYRRGGGVKRKRNLLGAPAKNVTEEHNRPLPRRQVVQG